MTRPRIVRADTLDLQDQHAPSAKDHSKHPGLNGGLAPHQEESIRHADQDTRAELLHGPGADGTHLDADDYRDGIDMYDDDDEDDGGGNIHNHRTAGSDDGDLDGESDDLLDDDLMDKISSSPSIDDEDIDFEFVYALHNFVATVDGQANAAKGDTMVLLDDSNSYWWLVRIVKDGSIGYLPAEHIETPTERLARLNKHRNVDLSATMLGDNSEKSKNPLKKAMRRRNAKTVTFTSPTYIEASDVEYSDEEDFDDQASYPDEDATREEVDDADIQNDDIVVEPLRPKSKEKTTEEAEKVEETRELDRSSPEKNRSSQEIFEPEVEHTVSRSRNGTVRNTDSFFKDDTVETKKISLTPNLLRDEVGSSGLLSDTKEGRGSLETMDKALGASDKSKDDKKRKDKKPGMLSGLFKRKDKKTKAADDDGEEPEKVSNELSRTSPTPKTSSESMSSPEQWTSKPGVQRQSSKLQKQNPSVTSPTKQEFSDSISGPAEDERAAVDGQKADRSIRQVPADEDMVQSSHPRSYQQGDAMSSSTSSSSPTKRLHPQGRDALASVSEQDEPQDRSDRMAYLQHSVTSPPQRFAPQHTAKYQEPPVTSPVHNSPMDRQRSPSVPGLVMDSSPVGQSTSPISPPLSPAEHHDHKAGETFTPFDMAPVEPPTWSDASLRSYLDDENDIRDLFIIVHDNSNVPPAGPDHPITGSLFKEESKRLKEMTSQLDSMLADWVNRKTRASAAR